MQALAANRPQCYTIINNKPLTIKLLVSDVGRVFSTVRDLRVTWRSGTCYKPHPALKEQYKRLGTYGNPMECGVNLYQLSADFKVFHGQKKKPTQIGAHYFYCDGEMGCTPGMDGKCEFRAHAYITASDMEHMTIVMTGAHNWMEEPTAITYSKLPPSPEVRSLVEVLRTGMRATPSKILLHLLARAQREGYGDNPQQLPSIHVIRNLVRHCQIVQGKKSDVENVWSILQAAEYKSKILYPKRIADFPQPNEKWVIVLADEDFLDNMRSHGQEIAMIPCLKQHGKYRIPILAIGATDDWNNGVPGCIMICSDNNSDLYCKGLEILQDAIGLVKGARWEPKIMLDHDATIAAAWQKLKDKGRWKGELVLCMFHFERDVNQNLRAKVPKIDKSQEQWVQDLQLIKSRIDNIKRSRTRLEVDSRIAAFRVDFGDKFPEVLEYMEAVFFCEQWKYSWTDVLRPSRRGLYNTNNFLEAFFKVLVHVVLADKGHFRICIVLMRIFCTLMPMYALQKQQKQAGLIPKKESIVDKEERTILKKGREIFTDHLRQSHRCALIEKEKKDALFYYVHSTSTEGVKWMVVYDDNTNNYGCTCPWYLHFGKICKHIVAVALLFKSEKKIDVTAMYIEGRQRILKAKSELTIPIGEGEQGFRTMPEFASELKSSKSSDHQRQPTPGASQTTSVESTAPVQTPSPPVSPSLPPAPSAQPSPPHSPPPHSSLHSPPPPSPTPSVMFDVDTEDSRMRLLKQQNDLLRTQVALLMQQMQTLGVTQAPQQSAAQPTATSEGTDHTLDFDDEPGSGYNLLLDGTIPYTPQSKNYPKSNDFRAKNKPGRKKVNKLTGAPTTSKKPRKKKAPTEARNKDTIAPTANNHDGDRSPILVDLSEQVTRSSKEVPPAKNTSTKKTPTKKKQKKRARTSHTTDNITTNDERTQDETTTLYQPATSDQPTTIDMSTIPQQPASTENQTTTDQQTSEEPRTPTTDQPQPTTNQLTDQSTTGQPLPITNQLTTTNHHTTGQPTTKKKPAKGTKSKSTTKIDKPQETNKITTPTKQTRTRSNIMPPHTNKPATPGERSISGLIYRAMNAIGAGIGNKRKKKQIEK